jgi:hypothetical protein
MKAEQALKGLQMQRFPGVSSLLIMTELFAQTTDARRERRMQRTWRISFKLPFVGWQGTILQSLTPRHCFQLSGPY